MQAQAPTIPPSAADRATEYKRCSLLGCFLALRNHHILSVLLVVELFTNWYYKSEKKSIN